MNPALEVRGLTAGYDDTIVLRDVSLTVPSGAVVALLGPNGAGKTTLLRAISGFLAPRAGTIALDGRDVTADRPHRRFAAGLCQVPEGRGIFRSLTVRENLRVQAPKGREADALDRAVGAFPILGERLGQRAGTLSGGQQQMLALAAAHVRDPALILVDEASLGLAPVIVDHIFAFLQHIAGDGVSLLIVEQYAHRVLAIASDVYLLSQGSIVYSGPAGELDEEQIFALYAQQSHQRSTPPGGRDEI